MADVRKEDLKIVAMLFLLFFIVTVLLTAYVILFFKLILQPFCHFTYVTTYSPTLPSLYLHHSSFSNSSVDLPTLQLILQPFCCFTYVTGSSLTSIHLIFDLPSFLLFPTSVNKSLLGISFSFIIIKRVPAILF